MDVLYVAVGLGLWLQPRPMLKGFGLAIAIQGLALFCFDLLHAIQI